jgi:hypothetical protein
MKHGRFSSAAGATGRGRTAGRGAGGRACAGFVSVRTAPLPVVCPASGSDNSRPAKRRPASVRRWSVSRKRGSRRARAHRPMYANDRPRRRSLPGKGIQPLDMRCFFAMVEACGKRPIRYEIASRPHAAWNAGGRTAFASAYDVAPSFPFTPWQPRPLECRSIQLCRRRSWDASRPV